jgi:hypothetical protein
MSKKLITACMALFALAAFILPAAASANPVITHPTGTVLNPKAGECTNVKETICITGTSVGNLIMWNTGHTEHLVTCSKANMTGYLTKNETTGVIEGDIHTATFGGTGSLVNGEPECTGSFGNITVDTNVGNGTPWCLKSSGATDTFTLRGGSCTAAQRSITFVLTSTTVGTCKYNREAAASGTFTTDTPSTNDAVLSIVPTASSTWVKEEGGFLCPSSGELEQSFTLETDTTAANDPLYIST